MKEIQATRALFPECTISHAKREANSAAHGLAQHAMRTKEFMVTRFSCHACIRGLVM
jgi:hypothetical protein